jgi:uncharacterized protein (DUF1810 family)
VKGVPVAEDDYDLQRFVDAQRQLYPMVVGELRDGRKRTHWIWFVFPQLTELGRSPTAIRFGISSLAEAVAYLAHEVLGPRLRECARLVAQIEGRTIEEAFGFPDYVKVRSSMTLFALAARAAGEDDGDFVGVLDKFYDGENDPATVELLT